MKPPPFGYETAHSAEEAAARLADLGDEAKILAGGQSLVPLLALRLARPSFLIDIDRSGGMEHIEVDERGVHLGALVRHREVGGNHALRHALPLLAAAARHIGHRAIQNRGTLGGSLAHADPAAELPAAATALDATIEARSVRGRRQIPASQFFRGFLSTALAPDEVLEEVHFPLPAPGTGWSFEEFSRRQGDFALAAVAVTLTIDRQADVTDARVVLSGAGSVPIRSHAAEAVLRGARTSPPVWDEAVEAAVDGLVPPADVHGTSAYRRHLIRVLLRRALAAAASRAIGPAAEHDMVSATARQHARTSADSSAGWTGRGGRDGPRVICDIDRVAHIEVEVNGDHHIAEVEPRTTLAELLRDHLGLRGTHLGCEHGVCGACTVLVDGSSVRSCLLLAVQVDRRAVTTVESLGTPDRLHPLQRACLESHSFQCGFCTPGFLMAASELLGEVPSPTEIEIRTALSGNVCRCTGYQSIIAGVMAARPGPGPAGRRPAMDPCPGDAG